MGCAWPERAKSTRAVDARIGSAVPFRWPRARSAKVSTDRSPGGMNFGSDWFGVPHRRRRREAYLVDRARVLLTMRVVDLNRYAELMWEAKLRIEVVRGFLVGDCNTTYVRTNTESVCLQLRKLLELIAFASLVSHRDAYAGVRENFARDWHAKRIIGKVESLNSKFYPRPISGFGRRGPQYLRGGFLTRRQFELLYDRCGGLMHATNPFRSKRNFDAFSKLVPDHLLRIEKLLSSHVVTLAKTEDVVWSELNSADCPPTVRYLSRE